jgi:hypothetical protein
MTDTAAPPAGDDDLALRVHLGSRHALANWPDAFGVVETHEHEHDGPGTIRSHPRADRSYDVDVALAAFREGLEMNGITIPPRLTPGTRRRQGPGRGAL